MVYHRQIANYFNQKGVSVIFLFRRNLLRRLVSLLANAYDKDAKLINGTHMSHVHTREEVSLSLSLSLSIYLSIYLSLYISLSLISMAPTNLMYIKGKRSVRLFQTIASKVATKPMCIISEQPPLGSQIKDVMAVLISLF